MASGDRRRTDLVTLARHQAEQRDRARLVEIGNETPVGFNTNPLKELLLRVAGDKDSNISAKRLGEWLRRNSGRVVRLGDGRRYWLIRKQAAVGRAAFRLSEIK